MLKLTYLLLPLGFLSFGTVHQGHHITFIICGLLIAGSMIREKPLRLFVWYAAIWCVFIRIIGMASSFSARSAKSVLSLATDENRETLILSYKAFDRMATAMNIQSRHGMTATSFMLVGAVVYIAASRYAGKKEGLFDIICAGALFQSAIGFLQIAGIDPVYGFLSSFSDVQRFADIHTVVGTLMNPNFVAGYLAVSLPFFFRNKWKWFIPFIAYHLLTLESSCGMATALVAIIVYFRSRVVIALSVLAGSVYVVFFDIGTFTNPRWGFWDKVLERIFLSPVNVIFGVGPGANTGFGFPIHNEWLECWYYYGLIGLFLMVLYLINIDKTDKILCAGVAAASINCLGSYPMHLAPSGFLILMIMGLLEREKHGRLSYIN